MKKWMMESTSIKQYMLKSYSKSTTNLGLWFKKFDKCKLKGYYSLGKARDKASFPIHYKSRIYIHCICCFQLLYIKHKLEYYNIFESSIPLLCDNIATINLSKNLILHSREIEIKHHFIRYYI
ncbi:hypothetical protein CR513_04926, partial [Mucuna pruriens]